MPRLARVRRKVFVTRAIDPAALMRLCRVAAVRVWDEEMPPPVMELRRALAGADAVLSMITDKIDASVIAGAPRLRVISNLGVGVDNIDLAAATRAGIAVGHTPGVLTDATADLAFGLLMATARRIAEADRHVRAGKWRTWGPMTMLGRDVHSSTIGLIGFGAIGQAMARRATGFGMRVLYLKHSSSKRMPQRGESGLANATAVSFPRLLAQSDYVSIHVPLTAKTRHMIGAREFALMKPGAILINTARGAVVWPGIYAVDVLAKPHYYDDSLSRRELTWSPSVGSFEQEMPRMTTYLSGIAGQPSKALISPPDTSPS